MRLCGVKRGVGPMPTRDQPAMSPEVASIIFAIGLSIGFALWGMRYAHSFLSTAPG